LTDSPPVSTLSAVTLSAVPDSALIVFVVACAASAFSAFNVDVVACSAVTFSTVSSV